jgi:hypothetical protein
MQWFDVDKAGLAKLLQERGAAFSVLELVQNALDTQATEVTVDLVKAGKGLYSLTVTDNDPEGFSNLAHAFTLFAESEKKGRADLRGRFNLGEKLVLALCDNAEIRSTKGSVRFDAEGRHVTDNATEVGSVVALRIRLSDADAKEVARLVKTVLIPENVTVTYNGERLDVRKAIRVIKTSLPTVIARADGVLRNSVRKTDVRLVEIKDGEKPTLYELGIPVVEIDLPVHVDVQQKVPLGFNRDNVTPAYRRALCVAVANEAPDLITSDGAASRGWATEALTDPSISAEAVAAILEAKYEAPVGNLVRYDPSDPESRNEAQSRGLTVVGGRAFSPEAWEQINRAGLLPAAGKVTPSRNSVLRQPEGDDEHPLEVIAPSAYTEQQNAVVAYAVAFAEFLLGKPVMARIVKDDRSYSASWAARILTLNAKRLSRSFWTSELAVDEIVLHEVAHNFAGDHLDHVYYEAVTRLGAKARRFDQHLPGRKDGPTVLLSEID